MENVLKVENWYVKKQDLEAFLDGDKVCVWKLTNRKKRRRSKN